MINYENGYAYVDGYKFRKDSRSGYYLSTKNIETSRIRLHRYIWKRHNGDIPQGFEVHHKDENKDNNDISNLELLTKDKHLAWHAENASDELVDKWIDNLDEHARPKAKEWHKSEEGRRWHSEMQVEAWENRKPKKYTCKNCQEKFEAVSQRKSKYCSASCATAFRVKSGVDNEIRECVVCNSKFSINKYRKTKTCCRSCASKLIHINRKSSL